MANSSSKIFVNNSFDIDIVKLVLRRSWYWLVLIFAVFLTGAFFYLRYTKALYESKTLIQINEENQGANVLDFKSIDDESSISKDIELLRSELLFKKAMNNLDLKVSQYAEGDLLTEKRYQRTSFEVLPLELKDSSLCGHRIFIGVKNDEILITLNNHKRTGHWTIEPNKLLVTPFFDIKVQVYDWESFKIDAQTNRLYFEFNELNSLVRKHIDKLKVNPVDIRAKTIEISFQSHNSLFARDVVQAVSNSFLDYDESFKKESAENVLLFITKQLDSLRNELSQSKDSIMHFQKTESLPNAESYSESVARKMETFRMQEFELLNELRTLQMLNQKLKESPNSMEVYKMIPELVGKSFESSLNDQVLDLHNLIERKEDLSYKVTENNDAFVKVKLRIEQRINYINNIVETLESRVKEKLEFVRSEIKSLEKDYYGLPEKQMELSRLRNIQELNEKYYNLLTEKKVLYSISNAGYASKNKVLNPPSISSAPISPKRNFIYGIAAFLALSLGFSVLLFRYLTFDEISQLSELQKVIPAGIGILGSVPLTNRKMINSQLLVADAPKSRISESFRSIRTNLSFVKNNVSTIAVTSSISGEGKTFVALNMGGIIAMSGKKVVVIDLDMRKPKIHIGFEASNAKGMSNLLAGHYSVEEVVNKSNVDNLFFIPAGPIPPNPSELILSPKFDEVLSSLKADFDIIIIDNPPVGLVSDGVNVLTKVDVPIFVFKANYSKRHFITNLEGIAKPEEIRNLNVVLNGESNSKSSYGFGYGGYYSDEPKKGMFKNNTEL